MLAVTAGIDTGKHHLDLALPDRPVRRRIPNTPEGIATILADCQAVGVAQVGIEATGGYERAAVAALRAGGLRVRVLQPAQVRAFAKLTLRRAKTDALDAALIRDCTALLVEPRSRQAPRPENPSPHSPQASQPENPGPRAPGARGSCKPDDPSLQPLADALTLIDQITETIASWRQRREHAGSAQRAFIKDEITRLERARRTLLRALKRQVEADPALSDRFTLARSVPGGGVITAVSLVIRMPELGELSREEAASLAGLAPFDDTSGKREGERSIQGGRARVRRALFCAAMPASARWNPALMAVRQRLSAARKPFAVIIVACARKLLIQINAVIARGTPWQEKAPSAC